MQFLHILDIQFFYENIYQVEKLKKIVQDMSDLIFTDIS